MIEKTFELQNIKGLNYMEVISKSIIEKRIVPHLSTGKRGAKPGVAQSAVAAAIFHRLTSGSQWRMLPVKEYSEPGSITWNGVYYYFNKWFKDGSFQNASGWLFYETIKRCRIFPLCSWTDLIP